jgi:hypothetical protein
VIRRTKPDLIVLTGDNVYGEFDDKGEMQRMLCERMESYAIPWAPVFGNHDNESRMGVRWQMEMFRQCPHCLFREGTVTGHGNYALRISDGEKDLWTLFLLDSNGCCNVGNPHAPEEGITPDNIDYDLVEHRQGIFPDQIRWYRETAETIAAENGRSVPSLAFFHIPLVEANEAWFELEKNGFKDTEKVKYIDGIMGETGKRVFCGVGEDSLFEAMVELGSTKAMFNGHDHYNNATWSMNDIIFSYGYSIDYLAYIGISKEGSQRGCTMITCKPDASFEINKYNYYSDRYDVEGFEKENVTMQFEDVTYQVPSED